MTVLTGLTTADAGVTDGLKTKGRRCVNILEALKVDRGKARMTAIPVKRMREARTSFKTRGTARLKKISNWRSSG